MLYPNFVLLLAVLFLSCKSGDTKSTETTTKDIQVVQTEVKTVNVGANTTEAPVEAASAAGEGFHGKEVPILCYHQLRDWKPTDSKSARVYIMPMDVFKEELNALHDSGYTSILPDQLMDYLKNGKPLPPKPVMLTFDDATDEHYAVALPELEKYGFKGVFFIMTVVLNRPNYLTRDQVKEISDKGHLIACHTWDHHMTTKYKDEDWVTQLEKPTALLEKLTGKPVKYFAYPFGLWNKAATQQIKKRGYTAAFQLSAKKDDEEPYFTIRRVIADGNWTKAQMWRSINNDFKK